MNGLFEAAAEFQSFCQSQRWEFCFIGGLAVVRWGEPRMTRDVDVSILAGFGRETQFIDPILAVFRGRLNDAAAFALESRVVLARSSNGVDLDIVLAGFPFEEQIFSRSSAFEFAPGLSLTTASAEDLVVMKALAARDQDWADVAGIVARQHNNMDWDLTLNTLVELCKLKDDTTSLDRLRKLRRDIESN